MAMEDAVALVAALDEHPDDIDAALADYEAVRQPQVAKIQNSARPSLSWWEHFGRSHDHLPPWQFAYHFFTRSLTDAKLRRRDDAFVAATHERWRTVHGADPLRSSLEVADRRLDGRVVVVDDDAVHLPTGPLPLRSGPADDGTPWALGLPHPSPRTSCPRRWTAVAKGVAAGAALVDRRRRHRADPPPAMRGGAARARRGEPAGRGGRPRPRGRTSR